MVPRYEYKTVMFQPEAFRLSERNDPNVSLGWKRAWSDVDLTGSFVVYRRERPEYAIERLADEVAS